MIQEIDGKLYDFTDPKNNHENPVRDALDMAEKSGDVVIFNNLDDAVWFSISIVKLLLGRADTVIKGTVLLLIISSIPIIGNISPIK